MTEAKAPHPGAGHRQRLRDKFLEHGLEKFKDDEVLELLLTLATPRRDCKQPARELLREFRSLSGVLEAEAARLRKIKGIGPKNILGLKLIPEVARLYWSRKLNENEAPLDPETLLYSLQLQLLPLGNECFVVVYVDARGHEMTRDEMPEGVLDQTSLYPRQVLKKALALNASGIYVAHNHPGGNKQPSNDDEALTRKLVAACCLVRIRLLDHFIISQFGNYSFKEAGFIASWEAEYNGLYGD
jgi:DNA repair protein RadC